MIIAYSNQNDPLSALQIDTPELIDFLRREEWTYNSLKLVFSGSVFRFFLRNWTFQTLWTILYRNWFKRYWNLWFRYHHKDLLLDRRYKSECLGGLTTSCFGHFWMKALQKSFIKLLKKYPVQGTNISFLDSKFTLT